MQLASRAYDEVATVVLAGSFPAGIYVEAFAATNESGDESYRRNRLPVIATVASSPEVAVYRELDAIVPLCLAIYPTERWDMEDIAAEIEHLELAQVTQRVSHLGPHGVYRRCGPSTDPIESGFTTPRSSTAATTGILAVVSTCLLEVSKNLYSRQDKREWAFNSWYNRKHLPAELHDGTFHTGYRFANTDLEPNGQRLFIALYETDAVNPLAAICAHINHMSSSSEVPVFPYAQFLSTRVFESCGAVEGVRASRHGTS